MSEAYIFDAVRTPRGRGKADGALHEVPSVRLAATRLKRSATGTASTPSLSTT